MIIHFVKTESGVGSRISFPTMVKWTRSHIPPVGIHRGEVGPDSSSSLRVDPVESDGDQGESSGPLRIRKDELLECISQPCTPSDTFCQTRNHLQS